FFMLRPHIARQAVFTSRFLRTSLLVGLCAIVCTPTTYAAVTELVPWSYDNGGLGGGGLTATAPFSVEWARVSGGRQRTYFWGQGPVNYAAGVTAYTWMKSPGTLDVDLVAMAPGGKYGAGTGFKSFIQLWNDANNYIAVGLIHDPWACPRCGPGQVTLMI